MTTTVFNTKIREVDNIIPDVGELVTKKTDYNAKVSEIEGKSFTTSDYNKFTSEILDTKLKQANLVTYSDPNTVSKRGNKNKEEIEKLKTFDLSYFLGKTLFGDDGFRNMFVYQPTLNTLGLKENNATNYVIGWKSKGAYNSKFTPLHTAFLQNIKFSG